MVILVDNLVCGEELEYMMELRCLSTVVDSYNLNEDRKLEILTSWPMFCGDIRRCCASWMLKYFILKSSMQRQNVIL